MVFRYNEAQAVYGGAQVVYGGAQPHQAPPWLRHYAGGLM
jgi:hypothetical protein